MSVPNLSRSRMARASGTISMSPGTMRTILDRQTAKGDVLEVARLAGIMAAKKTSELIPLCHSLGLDSVVLDFRFRRRRHTGDRGDGPRVRPAPASKWRL